MPHSLAAITWRSLKFIKAVSLLKGNALQWSSSVQLSGRPPLTWIDFKKLFSHTWTSSSYEVNVVTAWKTLSAKDCTTLDEYVSNFWDALHAYNAFRPVTLFEQVEQFICGLPKELRNYCIKSKVDSMTQMMEIAQTGYDLCMGKMSAFNNAKTATKFEEKDEDKKSFGKAKFKGKGKFQRSRPYLSYEEKKELIAQKKCFFWSYFYRLSKEAI